ncbi:MAG: agmatinase, partial [Gaiellales bacterium]
MQTNRSGEPGFAGIATFSKLPLVLEPAGLRGVDVAIVGAPMDETVSNRPGSRFGPRAIRAADDSAGVPPRRPHMLLGVDPFSVLEVVDYGDAETVPGDTERSHRAIKSVIGEVLAAGVIPVVLGGDHSIADPHMTAVADHFGHGKVGVIHFDAHADTATDLEGVTRSHGTPMRLVVDSGAIAGDRFIQVGLRGWWPEPDEFAWMRQTGFRWWTMYELDERGFDTCLDEVIEAAEGWEHVILSIDIDALDPAYAPGTGTPEPGGLTMRELMRAARRVAAEVPVRSMEMVEVAPIYDPAGNITAINAHRLVIEALSGLALRRTGRPAAPELDR